VLRRLASQGLSIVYVSHKLKEIFDLTSRVTVLRDGRHVATRDTASLTRDALIEMMVGRSITNFFPDRAAASDRVLLDVSRLGRQGAFRDISFTLRTGEIVGLGGLVGAGRTELGQALFGHRPADEGSITLEGRPVVMRKPPDAIALGIVYLPEERKADGLFLDMSIEENLLAVPPDGAYPRGFLARSRVKAHTTAMLERFRVRAASGDVAVRTLSGGNQQKVLLARWLAHPPKVLIADEPTRGIDIGAKVEIYQMLRDLARAGSGVLLISSELPELIGVCDRILVLHEGTLAGELPAAEATEQSLLRLAAGAAA
jgi:ribose transport system ATP-binding protein